MIHTIMCCDALWLSSYGSIAFAYLQFIKQVAYGVINRTLKLYKILMFIALDPDWVLC